MLSNIALCGDIQGINLLLKYIPANRIKCIIASSKSPQDINYLEYMAFSYKKNIILHLDKSSKNYKNFIDDFKSEKADAIISNSYSMIFEKKILEIVDFNAFNFHDSFLPNYKGVDAVHYAIMNNESETGVTFHKINDTINEGDIIYQEKVNIDITDSWKDLQRRINFAKENILKNNLTNILNCDYETIKQHKTNTKPYKKVSKKQLEINPMEMSDLQIYNLIRANIEYQDSAYFIYNDKKKVFNEFETLEQVQKFFSKYR